jgi:hypothetical protein
MTMNQLFEATVKQANDMATRCQREPSLTEILSDSVTRALMRADGVERKELEIMLRDIAHELASDTSSARDQTTGCH